MSYLGYSYTGSGGTGTTPGGGTTTPSTPLLVSDDGVPVVSEATALNFVGDGAVVTPNGNVAQITINKSFPAVWEDGIAELNSVKFFNFITNQNLVSVSTTPSDGVNIDFTKLTQTKKRKVIKITGKINQGQPINIINPTPGLSYNISGDTTLNLLGNDVTEFLSAKYEIYDNGVMCAKDGEVTLSGNMSTISIDRELYPGDYIIIKEN